MLSRKHNFSIEQKRDILDYLESVKFITREDYDKLDDYDDCALADHLDIDDKDNEFNFNANVKAQDKFNIISVPTEEGFDLPRVERPNRATKPVMNSTHNSEQLSCIMLIYFEMWYLYAEEIVF